MSLDCYPLGDKKTITLKEQPLSADTAYNEDLFVSVVDKCQSIAVFDLHKQQLISSFRIGFDVLVDEVVYCDKGDYIACIGHKNGLLSVFTAFNWRNHSAFTKNSTSDKDHNATNEKRSASSLSSSPPLTTTIPTNQQEQTDGNALRVLELSVNVHESEVQDFRAKLCHLDCCKRSGNLAVCCGDVILIYRFISAGCDDDEFKQQETHGNNNKSNQQYGSVENNKGNNTDNNKQRDTAFLCHMISVRLSIWATQVRLAENYLAVSAVDHVQVVKLELLTLQIGQQTEFVNDASSWSLGGNRKQVIWNLNTRKLVKLPTLMQNTSSNLSSFHVCHPLELLGPASESIACRISAPIYLPDYCQNQLEAIVMLCKQFEKGCVKSVSIQPVYLSQHPELERLKIANNKHLSHHHPDYNFSNLLGVNNTNYQRLQPQQQSQQQHHRQRRLLESDDNSFLVSVTCVVTTLTNCYIYSLHGKKVVKSQTISHPDICVDSRHDLLNMFILTSLGLQVFSTGVCDTVFRYDWSSSADLTLSFTGMHKSRVLVTKNFIILVPSSVNDRCEVECIKKPDLIALNKSILHIVDRCDCISVRANLLTYLHASAQLKLLEQQQHHDNFNSNNRQVLQAVTVLLCKQLLQKKQTNAITNSKIDRAIKHLLETSKCDLDELIGKLQRTSVATNGDDCFPPTDTATSNNGATTTDSDLDNSSSASCSSSSDSEAGTENQQEQAPRRRCRSRSSQNARLSGRNASNEELIRIYNKMLDDLSVHSTDDNSSFSASFMRRQASSSGVNFGQQQSASGPAACGGGVSDGGDDDAASRDSAGHDSQDSDAGSVTTAAGNSSLRCQTTSDTANAELLDALAELDVGELLDVLAAAAKNHNTDRRLDAVNEEDRREDADNWNGAKTRPYVDAALRLAEAQFIFDRLHKNSLCT